MSVHQNDLYFTLKLFLIQDKGYIRNGSKQKIGAFRLKQFF